MKDRMLAVIIVATAVAVGTVLAVATGTVAISNPNTEGAPEMQVGDNVTFVNGDQVHTLNASGEEGVVKSVRVEKQRSGVNVELRSVGETEEVYQAVELENRSPEDLEIEREYRFEDSDVNSVRVVGEPTKIKVKNTSEVEEIDVDVKVGAENGSGDGFIVVTNETEADIDGLEVEELEPGNGTNDE